MKLRRALLPAAILASSVWSAPLKPPDLDFDKELADVVSGSSNLIESATFDVKPCERTLVIGPCFPGTIGNDFVGAIYNFKRIRTVRDFYMDPVKFAEKMAKFSHGGWKATGLALYYESSKKIYTTCFMIPPVLSSLALASVFGTPDAVGNCWLVHYKGELIHKDGITFRFWGMGDDFLLVHVDGRIVLSSCTPDNDKWGIDKIANTWHSSSAESHKYYMGHRLAEVGDWITLEPGVPLNMEVIMGEVSGNVFSAMLAVEVQGVEYPKGPQGNPILPMFKTGVPWQNPIEDIHADLVPGEICVTNGPFFCDYDAASYQNRLDYGPVEPLVFAEPVEPLVFAEPTQSPKFNIEFHAQSMERFAQESPLVSDHSPKYLDYVFGAKLKQISANAYNHELEVELFAIGEEIDGENYILLDWQRSCFTPTEENGRSHEFKGKTIPVYEKTIPEEMGIFGQRRGDKYYGYLVVVTDEQGLIVGHKASHKWLIDILENLQQIGRGRHFDKTGTRVAPPRPDPIGVY